MPTPTPNLHGTFLTTWVSLLQPGDTLVDPALPAGRVITAPCPQDQLSSIYTPGMPCYYHGVWLGPRGDRRVAFNLSTIRNGSILTVDAPGPESARVFRPNKPSRSCACGATLSTQPCLPPCTGIETIYRSAQQLWPDLPELEPRASGGAATGHESHHPLLFNLGNRNDLARAVAVLLPRIEAKDPVLVFNPNDTEGPGIRFRGVATQLHQWICPDTLAWVLTIRNTDNRVTDVEGPIGICVHPDCTPATTDSTHC
ncbi:hypothetical protein [Nonomuraea jabiensis]|uniref:hypothetical protein n=1 Tax=Nonomuraea jabiensis TaxID=882448 RepID=UPI003D746FE0